MLSGQCIPASAIMQFRRNVYEYSMKNSAQYFRMQSERADFSKFRDFVVVKMDSYRINMLEDIMHSCPTLLNLLRAGPEVQYNQVRNVLLNETI